MEDDMPQELRMVRPVGRLGDGRILYLFSDGTVRTADGALLK